jgi:hypothetical protein
VRKHRRLFHIRISWKENAMAPRTPNYAQDRMQRERAQRAKANEKAERRAEEAAQRKAAKGETPPEPGKTEG